MLRRVRLSPILWCVVPLVLLACGVASAQVNPDVEWKVLTPQVKGAPGQVVEVKIQARIVPGSHMYTLRKYSDTLEAAPSPTEVTVGEKSLISFTGRVKGSKPVTTFDKGFETVTEYWKGNTTIIVPVKIAAKAAPGTSEAWVNFYFQTCNESRCLPPTDKKLTFSVEVLDKQAVTDSIAHADSLAAALRGDTAAAPGGDTIATNADTTAPGSDTVAAGTTPQKDTAVAPTQAGNTYGPTGSLDDINKAKKEGFWAFIALSALMGLTALATPCVFPMIPITVSFFTKREQTSRGRAIRDAGFYGLGIVLTFCGLGLIVSLIVQGAGIQDFATNPWVNLLMAAIFMTLALNLFGMFEIQVPTSVLNRLNRSANNGSGIGGVMLMGLVFTLTSFTCTVPFVGTLLTNASKGDIFWPLLGTAVFATVFAFPFFLLAVFPALLKMLPKSGGWLNSVKVTMGFLEVAFAVKFIAGADLVMEWGIFTREVCLAIWIAVSVLITVYLLGKFMLPHDTPTEKIGPVRALFATMFLAAGFWLLTGLFGANLGEVEAQLPPPREDGKATASIGGGTANKPTTSGKAASENGAWIVDDYEAAMALAKKEGKPVFIDFTGYNCTNCRLMERTMFPRKAVRELMNQFILVRLHTDGRKPVHKNNQKMQIDRFGTFAIPFYAIYSPEEKLMATFPGLTREEAQFTEFLQKGTAAKAAPLAVNAPAN